MAIVKAPRRRVLNRWWRAAIRIKVILLQVLWLQTDNPGCKSRYTAAERFFTAKYTAL